MKKPTTKKLTKSQQYDSVDMYKNIYKQLFEDEVFYQIPRYPNVFVSQYNRFIKIYKDKKPLLLKPYFSPKTGYTSLKLTNNQGEEECHSIHKWAAMVWSYENPTFLEDCDDISQDDKKIELHHIDKVKDNGMVQPITNNFHVNIIPVYKYYHAAIEDIKNIRYLTKNGKYKRCDIRCFDDIAIYYDISLRNLYDLIKGEPSFFINCDEAYKISDEKIILITKCKKTKVRIK